MLNGLQKQSFLSLVTLILQTINEMINTNYANISFEQDQHSLELAYRS